LDRVDSVQSLEAKSLVHNLPYWAEGEGSVDGSITGLAAALIDTEKLSLVVLDLEVDGDGAALA
jgi:hypothetical protein